MPFCDGVELVGYHDLEGRPGFKLALWERDERWYLYLGHLWHPGWTVLDVTDPASPQLLQHLAGPADTWTLQVQAAEQKLITSLEPVPPEWGGSGEGATNEEGFYVWDLSDPARPERVGHWRSGGDGTHRNYYAGGHWVHACAGFADMDGRIYAAVDISDPANPRTAGRWWWPGQKQGEELGSELRERVVSHHGGAYEHNGLAFCPWMGAGMAVLDVSDPTAPSLVGTLPVQPPLGSWLAMHSCVPLPGTTFVVVNSEAIAERCEEPVNFVAIVDVVDPADPTVVSIFPAPTVPPGYPTTSFALRGGRFGPHNQHQPQGQPALLHSTELIFTTWFNAGLQIYDVRDPYAPQIVASYIPDDPVSRIGPLPTELVVQCEDVLVDRRGFIYMTEKNSGVSILRYSGLAA